MGERPRGSPVDGALGLTCPRSVSCLVPTRVCCKALLLDHRAVLFHGEPSLIHPGGSGEGVGSDLAMHTRAVRVMLRGPTGPSVNPQVQV